ncbi:MAG: ATP-binding cassette domain-containing protein [Candidatus Bathyarchaeia archaeon]|nr:ATP-binding cassette domain-containing protein [Candidatus Bathyarchaeota archaeon]
MLPIISAEGLTKDYRGLRAVDHINFEIIRGECFGFLGPNGAGKTTTMKMIQCVSPISSGTLTVKGMDVREHPREIKEILGVVPQENNLDPDLTVFKNLLTYARYFDVPSGEARRRASELLSFVQLEDKKDVMIESLSGGMKRRLILARALMNEPEILVLDEPTTGLDPQVRHLIWEKIRSLKREGVTIILTTHYMEEASQLCDRLVIMDLGRIIVEGNPQELVQEHIGSEVIEVDGPPEVIACVAESGEVFEKFGGRLHVLSKEPEKLASELIPKCKSGKITVRQATLEDVFLKLTGKGLRE